MSVSKRSKGGRGAEGRGGARHPRPRSRCQNQDLRSFPEENMKALIISADNFEDSELLVPYYRLKEAGVEVTVASLSHGAIKGKHGYEVAVNKNLDEVNPDDYGILILPGGAAPMVVRKEPQALKIARSFI